MQKRKIKNVYYSTAPECIEKEKVSNMDYKNAHITSGLKKYMHNKIKSKK